MLARAVAVAVAVAAAAAVAVSPAAAHFLLQTPDAANGNAGISSGNQAACTTLTTPPAGGGVFDYTGLGGAFVARGMIENAHGGGEFVVTAFPAEGPATATGNLTFAAGAAGLAMPVTAGRTFSAQAQHSLTVSWPSPVPLTGRGWIQVALDPTSPAADPYIQCVYYVSSIPPTTGVAAPPPPPPDAGEDSAAPLTSAPAIATATVLAGAALLA